MLRFSLGGAGRSFSSFFSNLAMSALIPDVGGVTDEVVEGAILSDVGSEGRG